MSSLDLAPLADDLHDWVRARLTRTEPVAIRHPLGFVCLPVERELVNACIHMWTPRLRRGHLTTSTIHCHSWDLTSCVLYGRVRNEVVELDDDPVAPTHRVFEIRSDGDRDRVLPTTRLVRWRRAASTCHTAGEAYTLPAGHFHRTVIPTPHEAATVVFADARPGGVDRALGSPGRSGHTVSRRRYDATGTALAIRTILERLPAHDDPRGAIP